MSMQFGFTADAPDILTRGTWDNPVMATVQTGRVGSPLFPLHYNWLFGEAGINGSVISVDGVRPTDATLADGPIPSPCPTTACIRPATRKPSRSLRFYRVCRLCSPQTDRIPASSSLFSENSCRNGENILYCLFDSAAGTIYRKQDDGYENKRL